MQICCFLRLIPSKKYFTVIWLRWPKDNFPPRNRQNTFFLSMQAKSVMHQCIISFWEIPGPVSGQKVIYFGHCSYKWRWKGELYSTNTQPIKNLQFTFWSDIFWDNVWFFSLSRIIMYQKTLNLVPCIDGVPFYKLENMYKNGQSPIFIQESYLFFSHFKIRFKLCLGTVQNLWLGGWWRFWPERPVKN